MIKILDEKTAAKIAAGEVIERPAGVLKELLENALDSGASVINIDIEDAGKKLIRVNDNGSGMDETDLALALKRHSTSKIKNFEDLDNLNTFGFRGEALYSVAAVSEISIASSTDGGKGARVSARAGADILLSPAPAVKGTTVEVKNLFFNTPARLKFLKSDSYERACLIKVTEEAALSNPEVNFNLKVDGRTIYNLSGGIEERMKQILGDAVASSMVHVSEDAYGFKAWLTPPDKLVSTRDEQFAFINKRPLSSKTLQQAVYKAYQGARANNKHPAYVIYMTMPPESFDVNIHPQKKDVRFADENRVFAFIMNTLSKKIFESEPQFMRRQAAGVPAEPELTAPLETLSEKVEENMGEMFSVPTVSAAFSVRDFEEREPYKVVPDRTEKRAPVYSKHWWKGPYRFLGALHKTYLIYENEYGITFLDQHAARERVLYEKYLKEFDGAVERQPLMVPVQIDLPASSVENLMLWQKWLDGAGFEMERFSARSVAVNAVPHILRIKEKEIKDFIISLSQIIGDPLKSSDALKKKTVALLACKKAIKAKESLSHEEAQALIDSLKTCEDGLHCPHGRPVLVEIPVNEIAKKLGR